jgi:hypothetical protein
MSIKSSGKKKTWSAASGFSVLRGKIENELQSMR